MINRSRKHRDTARLFTIIRDATIELRLALFNISGCGETVTGRGALTFPPLTCLSIVVPQTSCRDDSVVCGRSSIRLRPSCRARTYDSGRHAANVHTTPAVMPRSYIRLRPSCRERTYDSGRHAANVHTTPAVMPRSYIRLRPSCRERTYDSGRHVAHVLRSAETIMRYSAYCCQQGCRLVVAFWRRLASPIV